MTKPLIAYLISALALTALFSCEHPYDEPPQVYIPGEMILDIADIYQIHQDSGDAYTFTEEYMLFATVVMDDATGNIYKEAYVQDSTGGINLYELSGSGLILVGDSVRINLKGVKIVDYSGKMELVFDEILHAENQIIVQATGKDIEPAEANLSDIIAGQYDCELVHIDSVQFADSELGNTYAEPNGSSSQNRIMENCFGEEIIVRSSDYADFAGDSLPQGNGDITGVITKFEYSGGDVAWQLLIRSTNEVHFDGLRCGESE